MGQAMPESSRVLQINPEHQIVQAMQKEFDMNPESEKLADMTNYLYDQAILAE